MKRIPPDSVIARKAKLKPIVTVARNLGLRRQDLELYGDYKAKISPDCLKGPAKKRSGKGRYIIVTAITPTPFGEGKTVTTIGLSMALQRIGRKAISCIRQPSLGPVFGIKGGAAGGGYAQVVPTEGINLHLTGDTHAVGLAHNLCAAFLDNELYRANRLAIDQERIYWKRVIDISDRSLRDVRIGLGGRDNGVERATGFDITGASEVMAILALAADLGDLRRRLGRIVVAMNAHGRPVTAEDIGVAGAMAALLKDAFKPNLLQTLENTPCIIHTGPFANIAHGNSSVIADLIAGRYAEYVVTESGFGADCGAEKFFDIKCRSSGLKPDAAVLVCSVRALKMHAGKVRVIAGRPLDKGFLKEDLEAVESGSANLVKQIENIRLFGVPVVVCINRFSTDTARELAIISTIAQEFGAEDCVISELWGKGSAGGVDLARAVEKAAAKRSGFKFLYPLTWPIKEKIGIIARKLYGSRDVVYSDLAEEKISLYESLGYGALPVCMAKTHLSLSHDPSLKGRPEGFTVPVRDIRASIGAGFLSCLCGEVRTMPSLPSHPIGKKVDIDPFGAIRGLS